MKRPALILICLLLQACSPTTKELGNSLWDSLFGTPGVQLTDDDIQNMPYASQYMQLNSRPHCCSAGLCRGWATKMGYLQDQATLVTQHGRIVKLLLGGNNHVEVNNLAADPLIKPAQIVDGATWTRTMGWTEYQQVRYATARSVFKWDGTDTVKVSSDETPVRVLDEEVSTDQARWHNRYWIDGEKANSPVGTVSRRGLFPGENHSHQGGKTMIKQTFVALLLSVGASSVFAAVRQGVQQWQRSGNAGRALMDLVGQPRLANG